MGCYGNIESVIDNLLNKNFADITTEYVVNLVTGESLDDLNAKYTDLQSDEGFAVELAKTQESVDALIASLEPKPLPIPMEDVEDLACKYVGDSLYSALLTEILKKEDPASYDDLVESGALDEKPITADDLGVTEGINEDLDNVIPSDGIVKFLEENNPDFLEKTNEVLFDNLDPLLLGKPSNSGSRKNRDLEVLGFKIPLQAIMGNGKGIHFKLSGPKQSTEEAKKKIDKQIKDNNEWTNPCDFEEFYDTLDNEFDFEYDPDNGYSSGYIPADMEGFPDGEAYDSNFYPDGDDPLVEQDCPPGSPEDPITGDPIYTKESFASVEEDFCDPEPTEDFVETRGEEIEDIDTPVPNVDAIQDCIDSAIEKTNKIKGDLGLLGRYQTAENNLHEILYHYEPIYEYQKALVEEWRKVKAETKDGELDALNLGIQILAYNDSINEVKYQIISTNKEIDESKASFIKANPIYNDKLFQITINEINVKEETYNFFNRLINSGETPITSDNSVNKAVAELNSLKKDIISIIGKEDSIEVLKKKQEQLEALKKVAKDRLELINGGAVDENNLLNTFNDGKGSDFDFNILEREQASRVFEDTLISIGYDSSGMDFLEKLKKFSARFSKTEYNTRAGHLVFELSLMTDFPNPLPYIEEQEPGKISLQESQTSDFMVTVNKPDIPNIKIGNEYAANGGILYGRPHTYLRPSKIVKVKNYRRGFPDVADFYEYLKDVYDTNLPKNYIINEIVRKRGILYGRLIEISACPWIFFNAIERGDNDSRDPSKLRPASFEDNEPNQSFIDFWGSYKKKWDAKYNENINTYITPAFNELIKAAKKAGEGLANRLPTDDQIGIKLYQDYIDVKNKYEEIQDTILYCAQKRSEIEKTLSADEINNSFGSLSIGDIAFGGEEGDKENCPPTCCGPAGQSFKTRNYLKSSPPSSDCPTIFQKCWWKEFAKHATIVGLLPYPNGLPPIEDAKYFLGAGPSVRFGLKYWPVGYLPPAFIPIPIPNPIDGMPYIRIPLPMIWNIINPIVIPLPFNLGIIVIFIPFIGGFMPTPLVYLKEFITGSSLFLTGIRGPRFIPRKSDPNIKDPLEKFKQALAYGIPDKLIKLPGFGLDNIDSPKRIMGDLQTNMTKIMDSVPLNVNISSLREMQTKEAAIRKEVDAKVKDYNNKYALLDIEKPDVNAYREQLNSTIKQRKETVTKIIIDYIDKGLPNPKDIYFPQDKDKLQHDIPSLSKSIKILNDMRSSFVPIDCGGSIDFKFEMREILKLIRIPTPPELIKENLGVSNANKIFLRSNQDPRLMKKEEFDKLVKDFRAASMVIVHILMKGNKFSITRKIRKGAFSLLDFCEYEGSIKFPPIKVTNSLPKGLKFKRKRNPVIAAMYLRIMEGMSSANYTVDDFSKYVRYVGEDPQLIMRVKDVKKLIAKKLGLSRKLTNGPIRPLDKEEPLISNFPHPEGSLCCLKSLNEGFGKAISLFELPTCFPPKQDQIGQIPYLGGILQTKIPGSKIKAFIMEFVKKSLDTDILDDLIPEITDINSTKFLNLEPADIQKMARNIVREVLNPDSKNTPAFLKIANLPIPASRPTDIIEQTIMGMGAPPFARIPYSLYWKYFKGVPKTPLGEIIVNKAIEEAAKVVMKLPWPLVVLMGRHVINLINPIVLTDDHPVWRRMSLKNTYYVIYLDEFIRSAADVSGMYKFALGAADPTYPIPELKSELKKAFNIKKY